MAMPDGVDALLHARRGAGRLADANGLQRRRVQPVGGGDSRRRRCGSFPGADITWDTDLKRQSIVDSWPADVDDSAARRDWGFAPQHTIRDGVLANI